MGGYRSLLWFAAISPAGNLHLLGSHIVIGRIRKGWQVLVIPRHRRNRRFSFSFGFGRH